MICLDGVIEVEVAYAGETALRRLDSPDRELLIEPPVWSRQTSVGAGAQLLALMSAPYDPADYLEKENAAPAVP